MPLNSTYLLMLVKANAFFSVLSQFYAKEGKFCKHMVATVPTS